MTKRTRIVAIANQKGGVGKSTIAALLASGLPNAILIDADHSSRTVSEWAAIAAETEAEDTPPVVGIAGASLRRDLPRVAKGYDVAVVDTAPRAGAEVATLLTIADLVLLPVDGPAALWALGSLVDLILPAREVNPRLKARTIVNAAPVGSTMSDELGAALAELAEEGIKPMGATLAGRIAHPRAMAAGQTALDFSDRKAAAEAKALVSEVYELLEMEAE